MYEENGRHANTVYRLDDVEEENIQLMILIFKTNVQDHSRDVPSLITSYHKTQSYLLCRRQCAVASLGRASQSRSRC